MQFVKQEFHDIIFYVTYMNCYNVEGSRVWLLQYGVQWKCISSSLKHTEFKIGTTIDNFMIIYLYCQCILIVF